MSAQPEDAPAPPAPAAAARLLQELRADRRAGTWVPAFEQDWARALDDARHSFSLSPVHAVISAWRARLASLRRSTRSSPAAWTTPTASTWTRSSEPVRERRTTALARPPLVPGSRHRKGVARPRPRDAEGRPGHRRPRPRGPSRPSTRATPRARMSAPPRSDSSPRSTGSTARPDACTSWTSSGSDSRRIRQRPAPALPGGTFRMLSAPDHEVSGGCGRSR